MNAAAVSSTPAPDSAPTRPALRLTATFALLLWTLRALFVLRRPELIRGALDAALGVAYGAAVDLGLALVAAGLVTALGRTGLSRVARGSAQALVLAFAAAAAIETEYFAWGHNRFDATFVAYAQEWRALGGSISGEASHVFLALHALAAIAASIAVFRAMARPQPAPRWALPAMALAGLALASLPFAAPHRGRTWFGAIVARSPEVELVRAVASDVRRPAADDEATRAALDVLRRFTNASSDKVFLDDEAPLAHEDAAPPEGVFAPLPPGTNVLFVLLEGMEAWPLAHAGGDGTLTPELDRLASQGLYFRRFFANGAHTPRAMDASLCGLYPRLTGAPLSRAQPRMPVNCLSAVLRDRGYRTAFIHGGMESFENRFEFLGNIGFHETVFFEQFGPGIPRANGGWGATDEQIYEKALAWLDAREPDRPFFLTVLSISNHHPFHVPDAALELAHDEALRPNNTMRYADRELGRFVDALGSRGLLSNTVVFILGDHGLTRANVNAAGEGGLQELLLSRANVPLIVLTPPGTVAPQVVERVASQVDLMPTALHLAGVRAPHHAAGRSLAHAIAGGPEVPAFFLDHYSGLVAAIGPEALTVIEVEPGAAPFAEASARWWTEGGRPRAEPVTADRASASTLRDVVRAVGDLYARERWWTPRLRLAVKPAVEGPRAP